MSVFILNQEGIFGNVVFQPEIFPGNNEVSASTKMLCQNIISLRAGLNK